MSETGTLDQLTRVQQIDLELDRLHAEEANIPQELRDSRAEQEKLNNVLEDTEITLEDVERQIRQLELDLGSTHQQIASAKVEQEKNAFDSRTQSQYGSRIQMLEERAEEMEEDLVPLRERQGELSSKSAGLRSETRTLRPKIDALEQEDQKRIQGLRDQGEGMRQERADLVGKLDSRTVKEYDQIRKAKKGVGIAEIKGGRCSACNVMLPVNIQQKAAQNKLPPVKCPSCGRFLIRMTV